MKDLKTERVSIDPITLRVLGGAFNAIAKEMAHTITRSAYSQIVRECEDMGAGIFDPQGNEFCESESTPQHIGSNPWYIRGFMTRLAGKLEDGDIIMHNHPYYGASHSPDVVIATPIFWEGKLIAFAAANAHLVDIGSANPMYNVDCVDVWSEGRLYYGLKIYERGVRNEQLWTHILDNVRAPSDNAGDIEALIAAVRLGKRRFLELIGRYGLDTVFTAGYEWMDYSEKRLRQEIEKVPDGEYYAEGWIDDDGRNLHVPLKVCITVKIEGSDITVDFTGSHPEVPTAFNCPFDGATRVAMYYIIRTIFLDEAAHEEFIPQNEGMFRPIKVIAPKGSIFNPRFPRSCYLRFPQEMRAVDLVIKALAQVVPQKIIAGCGSIHACGISGFDEKKGEYWAALLVQPGTHGGRYGADGWDCVFPTLANIRNTPIEELELRYPVRFKRYEMRDDVPPAAGKWRGGIGGVVEYQFLREGYLANIGDRFYEKPWGIFGGSDGFVGSAVNNPGTDEEEVLPSKLQSYPVKMGDVLRNLSGMAGGYGDPFERDPELVLNDVLDGYITIEMAERDYGVVIDPQAIKVDIAATRAKRMSATR